MTKTALCLSIAIIILSCVTNDEKIKAGSICTVENGDGKFGVVKVLVINAKEAHVKVYKNEFDKRPSKIDIKTLSIGSINDKDGFGIGHIPLERKEFNSWKPISVGYEKVTKEDLDGYEIWKSQ
jgi:hypothetical protein